MESAFRCGLAGAVVYSFDSEAEDTGRLGMSTLLRVRDGVATTVAGAAGVAAVALPLKLNILVAIAVAVTLCMVLEKLPRATTEPPRE